eukprot:TRINITY_DN7175_c0_g1_i8.p1 TRINITY_DN7175_c0_g1~~TRINITY_DN7175_c0_g1_i8.p1  ORF type:complete len:224 (+),score=67.81 TRINITY_DN7175_c0_g1_i8:97-768(+)
MLRSLVGSEMCIRDRFMLLADHLNQATAQAINSVYQFLGANGDLVPVHPLTPRLDNPSVLHRAASVAHVMSPDEQALISNMWQFSSAMSRTDSTGNCSCPPLIDCRAVALTTAHAKIQRAWGLLDLNSKGQVCKEDFTHVVPAAHHKLQALWHELSANFDFQNKEQFNGFEFQRGFVWETLRAKFELPLTATSILQRLVAWDQVFEQTLDQKADQVLKALTQF